jgi:hypothetical protein
MFLCRSVFARPYTESSSIIETIRILLGRQFSREVEIGTLIKLCGQRFLYMFERVSTDVVGRRVELFFDAK